MRGPDALAQDAFWDLDPDAAEAPEPDALTYVIFVLGGQRFAVDVAHVREILDRQPLTRLANAPHDVEGVIDVRGESVAVVELSSKLGLVGGAEGEDARIIVFEFADDGAVVGVPADRVCDVLEIPDEAIEASPTAGGRWRAAALRGIARIEGALISVLDMRAVFPSGGGDHDAAIG